MCEKFNLLVCFFQILLYLIWILGFGYGMILLFYGNLKNVIFNDFIAFVLLVVPFSLIFSWIFKDTMLPNTRIVYIVVLNISMMVFSLFFAFAVNFVKSSIEKRGIENMSKTLILRVLVMFLSVLSIAVTTSLVKSSLYKLDIVDYSFSSSVETIMNCELEERKNEFSKKLNIYNKFKEELHLYGEAEMYPKKKFYFIGFGNTRRYALNEVLKDENSKLEYVYILPSRSNPAIDQIQYSKNDERCILILPYSERRYKDSISTNLVLLKIDDNIEGIKKTIIEIEEKPASILTFSLVSFCNIVGIPNFNMKAKTKIAEKIDIIIKWSFYILTWIIFFVLNNNWKKK